MSWLSRRVSEGLNSVESDKLYELQGVIAWVSEGLNSVESFMVLD